MANIDGSAAEEMAADSILPDSVHEMANNFISSQTTFNTDDWAGLTRPATTPEPSARSPEADAALQRIRQRLWSNRNG